MSQPHAPIRLADHVRACHIGDQMILLDLRRDKYVTIGGAHLPALAAAIAGQPSSPRLPDAWIHRLSRQQWLSDTPHTAPPRAPAQVEEPVDGLTMEDEDRAADEAWRDLGRLWHATLVASRWRRRHSLGQIAERVAALRRRHSRRTDDVARDTMRIESARYAYLRPFALTAQDRCLADSLTLILFLAKQGLFPRWVVGVRVGPFGAHSWVQDGDIVLNDLPERVRGYRPILVV